GFGRPAFDGGDRAARDRAPDDDAVRDVRDLDLGRVFRLAGDFESPVHAIDRASDERLVHDAPVSSRSARTKVRCASSTLNALSLRVRAPSTAAAPARRNTSIDGRFPTSSASAPELRQGLVATPPSATRAARTTPPCTSRQTAAEARANAYEARSRTLT